MDNCFCLSKHSLYRKAAQKREHVLCICVTSVTLQLDWIVRFLEDALAGLRQALVSRALSAKTLKSPAHLRREVIRGVDD